MHFFIQVRIGVMRNKLTPPWRGSDYSAWLRSCVLQQFDLIPGSRFVVYFGSQSTIPKSNYFASKTTIPKTNYFASKTTIPKSNYFASKTTIPKSN